ncbi:MAG TPA: hypothetical protein VK766_12060 [Cytophagaceae bacterium]|nr:hypothetical protein [Cytophagaceae bacterium]
MKKIYCSLVVLFLFIEYTSAQSNQVSIAWSQEMEKNKFMDFADVLGRDPDGFYIVNENILSTISAGKNTAIIEKYDNSLNQIFSKPLIVKYHNNEVAYHTSFQVGRQFYMFTTFWDNKERVKYFLANPISRDGETMVEPKNLFEIEAQGIGAPNISCRFSFDSTKVLLFTDMKDKRNEEESYYFKALDQNLNPIWENRVSLPYSSRNFEIEKYLVDNNANVHILGRVKKDRKDRESGEPAHYYTLISYFYATKEIKEYRPDIGDAYASGIGIKPDKEGNIIVTGFYSEKSEYSLRGVFYMKIEAQSKNIATQKIKAFDQDFLAQFVSEKKASKGAELYNFSIDHIEIDNEGNAIIIAEQYYVETYTYVTSSGYTTTRYVYNYNHILSIKFSPQGDVIWWAKIPKLQRGSSATYFSYMYAFKDNKMYILYNDNKKNVDNLDPKKLATLANPKDAITVLVSIDDSGKITKIPMFEARDEDGATIFKPTTAMYLSESEYLVLSTRRKQYKLGKITF